MFDSHAFMVLNRASPSMSQKFSSMIDAAIVKTISPKAAAGPQSPTISSTATGEFK